MSESFMNESREDYLEAVLVLGEKGKAVRSVDIAHHLHVSRPSVTIALKNLAKENYLYIDEHHHVHLSREGERIAEAVYERHVLFTHFFVQLGVDPLIAAKDACRMEHIISEESYQALKSFLEKHHMD